MSVLYIIVYQISCCNTICHFPLSRSSPCRGVQENRQAWPGLALWALALFRHHLADAAFGAEKRISDASISSCLFFACRA
jgi:hypothetical protein